MTDDKPLTREDALILLDEFQKALPELESGDVDPALSEELDRFAHGLRRLPLPEDVLEEHVPEIEGWTELLLEGSDEEERAGVGSVPTLLESRIQRLRMMVDAGVGS